MVYLLEKHRNFLYLAGVRFSNKWFEENIKRYKVYDTTI